MTNEWQPIETAPKDGKWVLVYVNAWGRHEFAVCFFRDDKWVYVDSNFEDINEDIEFGAPTHWMPLPEPPKDKNG